MAEESAGEPSKKRRLADTIVTAFYQACRSGNAAAAAHLISALEATVTFEASTRLEDRRAFRDLVNEMRHDLLLMGSDQHTS